MRTVSYDLTLDDLEAGWRERTVRRAQVKFAWRHSRWRLIFVVILAAAVGAQCHRSLSIHFCFNTE